MSFKIENNFLNLTNYPVVAKHFEEMAAKGWLIHKIFQSSLFIYKRIEPENLDFSIAAYEIETEFTKKTKKELEEFKTVCENVGWNYVSQSFNLHIYYKAAGSEATPIQTDNEEEFKTLEVIAKKQIRGLYLQVAIFLVIGWMQIGGVFNTIYGMKDGIAQILAPVIVMFILTATINIFRLKRFLKINRINIEMGEDIEYSDSKFYIERISFILYIIFIILFVAYIFYSSFGLGNKVFLIAIIPGIIVITIGLLYRIFVKPSSISLNSKKIMLVVIMILSTIISIWTVMFIITNLLDDESIPDIRGLQVLSTNDFSEQIVEEDGYLRKDVSILIPKSYEYTSYSSDKVVVTEYADALNESLAKNLVGRYIKQAETRLIGRTSQELEMSFEEDFYIEYLEDYGFSESDYNNFKKLDKKEAIKMAKHLMKERSIKRDSKKLWNLDEVYFLSYDRNELVIRQGKEVFYLEGDDLIEGEDFTNPELIKIVKRKLGL